MTHASTSKKGEGYNISGSILDDNLMVEDIKE